MRPAELLAALEEIEAEESRSGDAITPLRALIARLEAETEPKVLADIDAWVYHGLAAALQGTLEKEWATEDGTWTLELYDSVAPEEGAELPVHVTITERKVDPFAGMGLGMVGLE